MDEDSIQVLSHHKESSLPYKTLVYTFISETIVLSSKLYIGLGRFKTSMHSNIFEIAPGVLLNKNDKIAYLFTSPSMALCKTYTSISI